MGMDIYVMKPVLVEKAEWATTAYGEMLHGQYGFRKAFKRFIFIKQKVHTIESMAKSLSLPVEQFIIVNDKAVAHAETNNPKGITSLKKSSEYPYTEPIEYILSEEISFLDGYGLKPEFESFLNYAKIWTKDTAEYIMNGMYQPEHENWKAHFKTQILDKFVEGETYISFD